MSRRRVALVLCLLLRATIGLPVAAGSVETAHEPTTVPIESAELLLAPENAESRIETLLEATDDEILVKQASIASDVSLLDATIDAARRGVEVRLILDSTWYVEAENETLVDDLERTAADEGLPLEARLVDDTDEFEKIHAKGIVVDRETAVVGRRTGTTTRCSTTAKSGLRFTVPTRRRTTWRFSTATGRDSGGRS
jgi:hypothetical protein